MDRERRREYMGYVGVGATSERADQNPFGHFNIFVFNHELFDHFHDNWLYSLGLSYRRQNAFEGSGDVWHERHLQELRLYGRYALLLPGAHAKLKLVNTFRPELRGFVSPDFQPADTLLQIRARLKSQLVWKLERSGKIALILASEALASVSRQRDGAPKWTSFDYTESRFSLFVSLQSTEQLVVDIGYMNNLIGHRGSFVDVHYFAVDLVWNGPLAKSSGTKAGRS